MQFFDVFRGFRELFLVFFWGSPYNTPQDLAKPVEGRVTKCVRPFLANSLYFPRGFGFFVFFDVFLTKNATLGDVVFSSIFIIFLMFFDDVFGCVFAMLR